MPEAALALTTMGPESGSWWKARQTELMSISDDHEYGLMTSMVTSTQNDSSPELLAHISPLGWAHILLTGEYRWKKQTQKAL